MLQLGNVFCIATVAQTASGLALQPVRPHSYTLTEITEIYVSWVAEEAKIMKLLVPVEKKIDRLERMIENNKRQQDCITRKGKWGHDKTFCERFWRKDLKSKKLFDKELHEWEKELVDLQGEQMKHVELLEPILKKKAIVFDIVERGINDYEDEKHQTGYREAFLGNIFESCMLRDQSWFGNVWHAPRYSKPLKDEQIPTDTVEGIYTWDLKKLLENKGQGCEYGRCYGVTETRSKIQQVMERGLHRGVMQHYGLDEKTIPNLLRYSESHDKVTVRG